jgi:hypothetical protein
VANIYITCERNFFIFLLSVRVVMSTMTDKHLERLDIEARLSEAIEHWRPDRPRRWLAKYGNISAAMGNPSAVQYRILRGKAESLLNPPTRQYKAPAPSIPLQRK